MRAPVIALAAALWAVPAFAAEAYALSIEELARVSDAVVRAQIVSAHPAVTADGTRIVTTFEVRTEAVLRGRTPKLAQVMVPGGVVGRFGQRVDAAPAMAVGEDVVLFLRRAGEAYLVTGLAQGKFSVVGALARPDLSSLRFVRTSVRAGERRSEEMPLSELERRVRGIR